MDLTAAASEYLGDAMPLTFDEAVVGGYHTHYDAEAAVRLLAKSGLPMETISIIGRNFETREDVEGFYLPSYWAREGAEAGAWAGGIFGLLVGTGLFILPVVGPVFVLGPLAAVVAGAIVGTGVGALINGLIFLGVSKVQAIKYQERIQVGEFLVLIHGASTAETERSRSLIQNTGHTHLQTHAIFHGGALVVG